jgi:hypothetical protein
MTYVGMSHFCFQMANSTKFFIQLTAHTARFHHDLAILARMLLMAKQSNTRSFVPSLTQL